MASCNQRTLGRRTDCEADLAAEIAALTAAVSSGTCEQVTVTTGTASLDETSAAEQTIVELALSERTRIGSIWLDLVNVTQALTLRVHHKIDGTNYRIFQENSWLTTDDDGVLLEGFTARDDIKVTAQCGGGGAGSVNVPYAVV